MKSIIAAGALVFCFITPYLRADEVIDAPFKGGMSAVEKTAIDQVFCESKSIGTGVHIGSGMVLWAQHSRQSCMNKGKEVGFGWKTMDLLYCNGLLDFCVSQIRGFKPNSGFAKNYISISTARPNVGEVLRSIGHPGGGRLRVSEGPVLRFDGSISSSSNDKKYGYTFTNVWKIAVSIRPGSSNSPALNARGDMVMFNNVSPNNPRSRTISELRANPSEATSGIEAAAIATKLLGSSLRQRLCVSGTTLYGCR